MGQVPAFHSLLLCCWTFCHHPVSGHLGVITPAFPQLIAAGLLLPLIVQIISSYPGETNLSHLLTQPGLPHLTIRPMPHLFVLVNLLLADCSGLVHKAQSHTPACLYCSGSFVCSAWFSSPVHSHIRLLVLTYTSLKKNEDAIAIYETVFS